MARVLLLSNLFPTVMRPQGAPFIEERVSSHRAAGHRVDRVDLRLAPATPLRLALARTGRDVEDPPRDASSFIGVRHGLVDYLRMVRANDRELWARRAAATVAKAYDVGRYDAIHAHGMYRVGAGAVAFHLSQDFGVPYSVTIHGSDLNNGMHLRTHEFLRVLEHARSAMYVSPTLRDRAIAMGAPSANAVVTGNGVDLNEFRLGTPTRQPEVLFVGNLAPVKGADRLPDIFEGILQKRPDATFTVVGVGPLEKQIRAACTDLPVAFLGAQSRREVAAHMRRASVLVVPSRNEGWPTVINEALASGTPVAATDVGGNRFALGHATDWVVDPQRNPVECLARLVVTLLASSPDRTAMRRWAGGYSWEAIATVERESLGLGE